MISPGVIKDPAKEGLLPVLPFGAPFDSTRYQHLNHLLIVAAASIGDAKTWINSLLPSWAAVFSLHATKSFGIGEGGLIIFGSKETADKFRSWINFGFNGSRDALALGTNAKLSEIQAAVGLAVMDGWDDEAAEWKLLRMQADKISEHLSLGQFSVIPKGATSPYWIISHSNHRVISRIEVALMDSRIETRRWWSRGCHLMSAFSLASANKVSVQPATEQLGQRYLGLPFSRGMSEIDFRAVGRVLSDCLRVLN
jgi:dTDP-4-amino-4,6-dideoxygalactose transaminase